MSKDKLLINKKTLKLSDIIPYKKNIKIHDDEQKALLVKSLKENKYLSPLILDKKNVIISGHGRIIALLEIYPKDTEIEVIDGAHLSKKQTHEYRVIDNTSADMAGYDAENLAKEIDAMYEGADYDVEKVVKDTGISFESVSEDLFKYLDKADPFFDSDKPVDDKSVEIMIIDEKPEPAPTGEKKITKLESEDKAPAPSKNHWQSCKYKVSTCLVRDVDICAACMPDCYMS
jgi:hypothetical protein